MVVAVNIHTADTSALKLFCQLILYFVPACLVDHIKSLVGTDVITVLPEHDRVHDSALHPDRAVNILERRFGESKKAESGRREPEIALIIIEHIVDGIVELVGIQAMISVRVHIGYTAVRGNEQCSIAQIVKIIDACNILTGHDAQLFEVVIRNIIAIDMICGSSHHQSSARRESAAVEQFLIVRKCQLTEDLALSEQEETSARSYRGDMTSLIGGDAVGIIHLRQRIRCFQAVIHHEHLKAARGSHIIVSVR